jgi:hypothetical protein
MMTKIEELWQSIRRDAGAGLAHEDGWKLVQLDPSHPFDIYAGVDGGGLAMLAIGTSSRPPSIDGDTGALGYVRLQRAGGRWLMGLRLVGPGLEGVFGRLCQDLADTAGHVATEAALISLFRERLLLWKRLFRDSGTGLMQKFQVKGLIAELLTLEEFIRIRPEDPLMPVMAWTGPGKTSQDFVFADHAVEVKAVGAGVSSVSISSAEQLDSAVPLVLRACVLREAAPSETDALTLPQLATRIEHLLAGIPGATAVFRDKLLEAGYVEHAYYQSVAFTTLETRLYAVQGSFPRIVPASLPAGIPDVSYTILFSAIEPFRVPEIEDAA